MFTIQFHILKTALTTEQRHTSTQAYRGGQSKMDTSQQQDPSVHPFYMYYYLIVLNQNWGSSSWLIIFCGNNHRLLTT